MKTTKKALLFTFCAVLLVVASILGTMAYLTSSETVTNTFTVGNVKITLDEAKVDGDGTVEEGASRVKGNEYNLIPGHTYTKDPTVTVSKGSEESYVRMIVSINEQNDLDTIFSPGLPLNQFFGGFDEEKWSLVATTKKDDTCSYEFRYATTVSAKDAEKKLEPLFETITVPGTVTNDDLDKIKDLNIDVVAHAIQADGFEDADAAWAAFDAQNKPSQDATEGV